MLRINVRFKYLINTNHFGVKKMIKICSECKEEFETTDARRKYCSEECCPKILNWIKTHFKRERWVVLIHYGGNPPKCACCGEMRYEFLAIDHIHGGGIRHAKEIGIKTGGRRMYHWLIKNNFPDGFRVLCHNCNLSMGFYGYCPHQSNRTEQIPNDLLLSNNFIEPHNLTKRYISVHRLKNIKLCRNCGKTYDDNGSLCQMGGFCCSKCERDNFAKRRLEERGAQRW
jgi:hypothetical protein